MEDKTRILQQRIEVTTIDREIGQGAGEGIGGEQHEGSEANRDQPQHAEYPSHRIERQTAAEHGHRRSPATQGQYPQQQGTFVGTPHRRDAIGQRQQAVGVSGHILHGEIVVDKGPGQAEKRQQQQQELGIGERTGRRHHAKTPPTGAQ